MKYFDYTATTPVDAEVLETYIKTTNNFFANTSSLHKLGQRSNLMYTKAIEQLKEVNTDGVEPLVSVNDCSLQMREDVVNDGNQAEKVLANAPMKEYGYFGQFKTISVSS